MGTYTKIGRIRPDYADVWDASRSYTALEVVKSADNCLAYIARQDVPAGVALTDTAYWGVVLDVSDVIAESAAATNRANAAAAEAEAFGDDMRGRGSAIVCGAEGEAVTVGDASDDCLRGLRVFGRTLQDGVPSPDVPVELVSAGDSGSVGVRVTGRNLLNPAALKCTAEYDGAAGSIASSASGNTLTYTVKVQAYSGGTYLKAIREGLGNGAYSIAFRRDSTFDQILVGFNGNAADSVVIFDASDLCVNADYYINFTVSNLGINTGTISGLNISVEKQPVTAFEPFQGAQSLAVSTPGGLPGVPVESGGNYTDGDGQQWVCDEIDFGRGVYVQRAGKIVLDGITFQRKISDKTYVDETTARFNIWSLGAEKANRRAISTHYPASNWMYSSYRTAIATNPTADLIAFFEVEKNNYTADEYNAWLKAQHDVGTPVIIVYALAKPVETPLTAEEIAAFRALHSYMPNTVVMNDAGAWTAVSYNADTKTYIDNKFAQKV